VAAPRCGAKKASLQQLYTFPFLSPFFSIRVLIFPAAQEAPDPSHLCLDLVTLPQIWRRQG
jgi:hypothetical protein